MSDFFRAVKFNMFNCCSLLINNFGNGDLFACAMSEPAFRDESLFSKEKTSLFRYFRFQRCHLQPATFLRRLYNRTTEIV